MSEFTDAIPLYKYSDLPSARSIRLIELQTGGDGIWSDITINLTVHDFDTAPDFDALSYTWGLSIPSYSSRANSTWGMDNVRRYPVEIDGRPLMVTANLIDALRMLSDSYIQRNARKSQYLWIDSISIDQGNPVERGAQVALMGSIYETARNVICWLGQEDEFTDDAFKTINALAMIPRERHSQVTFADWYNQRPALIRLGIFEELTPYMWCGLVAFLNRPWFSRVWIVQEVILAKSAIVVCGRRILPWSHLSNTISFLTTSGWHDHISSDQMRTVSLLARNPGLYRKYLDSHVGVGMAAIYLESTRTGIASSGHKALFRYLLHVHRFCDASEPLDMIYALLGVAWKERPPFNLFPDAIVPDYQISVRELYTRVARTMLRAYKDLRFLAHVQDATWTTTPDLPSWVPDYTVDMKPPPLSLRGNDPWKACGDLIWGDADVEFPTESNINGVKAGQLRVEGIYLDTIIDIIDEQPSHHDFRESADKDPFWISVWNLAKGLNDTYPAESLIGPFHRRRVPVEISSSDHSFTNSSRFQKMKDALLSLLSLEPPSSPFTPIEYEDLFSDVMEQGVRVSASWDPATQTYQSLTGQPQTAALTEYRNTFSDLHRELAYTWNSRRLFRTAKGYLGIGAQSLKRGDEVWILGGANTPMILRRAVGEVQLDEETGDGRPEENGGPGNPSENEKGDEDGEISIGVEVNKEMVGPGAAESGEGDDNTNQDVNQTHDTRAQEEAQEDDAEQRDAAEREEWEDWTDEEEDDTDEGPTRSAAPTRASAPVSASALPEIKITAPKDQEKNKEPELENDKNAPEEKQLNTSTSDAAGTTSQPSQPTPTEPAANSSSNSNSVSGFVPLNLPPGVQRLLNKLLLSRALEQFKTHTPAHKYALVGETYLHGVMYGEAVQGIKQDSEEVVRIILE